MRRTTFLVALFIALFAVSCVATPEVADRGEELRAAYGETAQPYLSQPTPLWQTVLIVAACLAGFALAL